MNNNEYYTATMQKGSSFVSVELPLENKEYLKDLKTEHYKKFNTYPIANKFVDIDCYTEEIEQSIIDNKPFILDGTIEATEDINSGRSVI